MERVSFWKGPNCGGQFPSWLENPQHLANAINRRRKKHHAKAANDRVKSVVWERQIVRECHVKMNIAEFTMARRSPGSCDHLRRWIYAENTAFRSNQIGNAQGGFARPRGHVENNMI